jgi:Transglycosylase SLT domain
MSVHSVAFNFIGKDLGVKKTAESVGAALGKLGKTAAFALGAAAVTGAIALTGALADGVKEAMAYEVLAKKTGAVIKSTGNAANVSVKGVQQLASSLENMSGVDETLIINSENVLATFTKVRNATGKGNDIFNQGAKAALNMSVALGTDLQGATTKIGKALQDPAKGLTALSKAGVQFTDSQKSQILAMTKSGNIMGAQKIILGELEKKFGGTAKAAGETLTGSLARLKDSVSDTFRDVATKAIPGLTKMADGLANWVTGLSDVSTSQGEFMAVLTDMNYAIGDDDDDVARLAATLRDTFTSALNGAKTAISDVWDFLANKLWPSIKDALDKVMPAFQFAWDQVTSAFKQAGDESKGTSDMFSKLWTFIDKYIIPTIAFLAAAIAVTLGLAFRALMFIVTKVVFPILALMFKNFSDIGKIVFEVAGKIKSAFVGAKDWLTGPAKEMIQGLWNGMTTAAGEAWKWIKGIGEKIVSAVKGFFGIHSPSTVFEGLGVNMLQGLLKGLASTSPLDIAKTVFGSLPKALGEMATRGMVSLINLPSKAMDALRSAGGMFAGLFGGGAGGGNSANQALGQIMAASYGWTGGQWDALRALWNGESGWNNNAQNPTSTAYGIAQFLNSTWGSVGASKSSDPATQIAAGLKYIQGAYGSPSNAYAKWLGRSPHWYDNGGWLQPGYTLAYNGTGQAERVLSPDEMAGGGTTVRVFIGDTELKGIIRTEVDKGMTSAVRAASNRRAGR